MGLLLIAKELNDSNTLYRVYNTEDNKIETLDFNQVLNSELELINFRLTANKKKITILPLLAKPSVLKNGEFIEEHLTLISIEIVDDKPKFNLIDYNGQNIQLDVHEYMTQRIQGINNEFVVKRNGEHYISVKRYCSTKSKIDNIIIEDRQVDTSITETKEDTDIENEEDASIENEDTQSNTDTDIKQIIEEIEKEDIDIKQEIERIENECNTQEILNKTAEFYQNAANNKNENIDYKTIIFNMYPMDRITITMDEFEKFKYVILRILDSNMSDTKRLAFCQLFKTDNKNTNYTYALVEFNEENKTCTIQVAGQSDIPEKAMKCDIEKFCMTYAVWLKEAKFIRI